jgi:hypothetical protein
MITKFKSKLIMIALLLTFSVPMVVPALVAAATTPAAPSTTELCSGASLDITGAGGCAANSGESINTVIKDALNIFSAVVGIIAVVTLMIGGIKYITSGGSSEKTSSAKDTILFAIVGLVVVALAQIVVAFVLTKVG